MGNDDELFRRTEGCLYGYRENVARLEALRSELKYLDGLSSAGAQRYDAVPSEGFADLVSARLERIEEMERDILALERWTRPIDLLIADLSSSYVLEGSVKRDLLKILELRYLSGNTWARTEDALHVGRSTLLRRRRALVEMAGRYLGL